MSESVVVIGAGVTGLTAARELRQQGHDVVVLEAGRTVGGQVRSERLGEHVVDLGAETVPLRAPGVDLLVADLGLTDSMRHPLPGRTLLSSRRGVIDMPPGVTPTGLTRFAPTIASGMLSPRGLLRAGTEPLRARSHDADVSVGQFITERFGPEVGRAVVDPLLGGIHAADIDSFSLAVAAPALVRTVRDGESIVASTLQRSTRSWWTRLLHREAPHGAPGPTTATWGDGLVALPLALAEGLDVRTGCRATALTRCGSGWTVRFTDASGPGSIDAHTVVLTTPARVSSALLAAALPEAASLLGTARSTTVATLVMHVGHCDHPIGSAQTWFVGSAWSPLVRQVTNLTSKWPQLPPTVLRIALGRTGGTDVDALTDDQLVERTMAELRRLGLDVEPDAQVLARFPGAMPQPAPGHRDRMASLARLLAGSGVRAGGAGVDGAGVGTAVVAGRRLARQITSKEIQ